MAGPGYQLLCHSIGVLSLLIACVFIVTGICLQVFHPENEPDTPIPWRTDGIILTIIGVFALVVFVFYFCHVARRRWKVFNVISIRPHYKRRGSALREHWHASERQQTQNTQEEDSEVIDGITPAQAYSRRFSLDETESSVSEHSEKQLVKNRPQKPPRQGRYKLPRKLSDISNETDNMEIVPAHAYAHKNRKENKGQGQRSPSRKKNEDSPKSSLRDYVIRSSQRYSINEPIRDERVEAKAKADRELMESLGNKKKEDKKFVIVPTMKSIKKNVSQQHHNGGVPSQRSPKQGIDNEAYVIQPSSLTRGGWERKFPNGILKKSENTRDDDEIPTAVSDDEYIVQSGSRKPRKFQKRAAHGALRHSSHRVSTGGLDESTLDKPSWVVTAI